MDYGDKWREQPIFDTLGSIVARPAVESSDTGGLEDVMWSLNSTFRHTSAARMQQLGAGDGSAEAFDPRPDPLGLGSGDAPLTLFRHNSFPARTEQLGNTRQVNMADLTTSADRVRHEEDAGAGSLARDGPTPPTTAKQPPTQNLQDGPVSTTVSSPLSRRPLRAPADGHTPPKRKSPAEIADSVRLGVRSASAFDEAAAAETLTLEEEISRWAAPKGSGAGDPPAGGIRIRRIRRRIRIRIRAGAPEEETQTRSRFPRTRRSRRRRRSGA